MPGYVNGLPPKNVRWRARARAQSAAGFQPAAASRTAPASRAVAALQPAGSTAAVPSASAVVLAAAVRACPVESDGYDDPPVALHSLPVVVPVRVLTGDGAVIVDEQVHGIGKPDDLGGAFGLDPVTEESVVHDADGGVRISLQVLGLHGRLAGADDHPALTVDANGHRRQLRKAVGSAGGKHGPVVGAHELPGALQLHGF